MWCTAAVWNVEAELDVVYSCCLECGSRVRCGVQLLFGMWEQRSREALPVDSEN